jgi:hypothetical protein
MRSGNAISLFLAGASALALAAAGPARADETKDLRGQIESMQDRIAKLEADRAAKRRVAAAAAVEAGDKPRSWKIPGTNTSMNIGGYTKLDVLWDVGSSGSLAGIHGDAVAVWDVTAGGNNAANNRGNGGNFRLHARQSRFWIQTWTPTDWGELRTYIETDFFGAGNTLRLRHAYGVLGPVLAGQTWSTIMPVFAGADTLDFGGPTGQVFVRQAMVRYTHNFGGGLTLDFAIEDPTGDRIIGGTAAAQRMPDLVVAANYIFPQGRLYVGGILRMIEHDTGAGTSADSQLGWGVVAAATFKVMERLSVGLEGSYGRGGLGKYLFSASGFSDAILTAPNRVRAIETLAGKAWAQLQITDTIAVLAAYGYSRQDVRGEAAKAAIPAGTPNWSWSIQGNVTWNPVRQVTFGIEYSYFFSGRYNGSNGTVNRVQASAQYRF